MKSPKPRRGPWPQQGLVPSQSSLSACLGCPARGCHHMISQEPGSIPQRHCPRRQHDKPAARDQKEGLIGRAAGHHGGHRSGGGGLPSQRAAGDWQASQHLVLGSLVTCFTLFCVLRKCIPLRYIRTIMNCAKPNMKVWSFEC